MELKEDCEHLLTHSENKKVGNTELFNIGQSTATLIIFDGFERTSPIGGMARLGSNVMKK
jgi:hypothetical protein